MPEMDQPRYLTTKEVAELLRVRERKVYDLAAADEIPHRRITGKLLFPAEEIHAWIEGGDGGAPGIRPDVVAGSHDPLLDWAIRESGAGLATLTDGSLDGLERFAAGQSAAAGMHVPEDDGWNIATVTARGLGGCVLIGWATRARGILLADGLDRDVQGFADLKGRRMALRQEGAGAAALLGRLLKDAGMTRDDVLASGTVARTESDAAAAVAAGEAEAALGIGAMARQFGLGFVPLVDERFDLLIDRRAWFTPPFQRLMAFTRTDAFRAKAEALGGYDVGAAGEVRWLSR